MLTRVQFGDVPRKHHIACRDAEGRLRHEECFTRAGFDGPYTIAYHRNRPHAQHVAEARHGWKVPAPAAPRAIAKRHYRTQVLAAAGGALVCSFVPRVVDFHPEAIPCPYPHASVDVDEILFYVRGEFTSRRGVGPGSISHHPAGVMHGPHPGAYEGSIGARTTSELAVMLDCYQPLSATPAALAVEDPEYQESFVR